MAAIIGAFGLILVAVISVALADFDGEIAASPVPDEPADTTEPSSFFMPQPQGDEDPPFWTTTFGLVIPPGYWEPNSVDPELCGPTTAEGLWTLTTEEGTVVAAFDNPPLVTFGRVSSAMDDAGNCQVVAVTMGDYIDDLSNSYTISDGTLEATFTPEQLFAGQDDGGDHYEVLQPG